MKVAKFRVSTWDEIRRQWVDSRPHERYTLDDISSFDFSVPIEEEPVMFERPDPASLLRQYPSDFPAPVEILAKRSTR